MFGQILMNFLFASAIVSSGAYFLSFNGNDDLRRVGRIFLYMLGGGMILATIMLMYFIMTHNFSYTYVWSYSSRDLPTPLLASTFYAGQEGSFLLWTLWTAIIGILIIPYVRRHKYESEVMAFFALILVFLLLKLVAKSPFAFVWETFAKDAVAEGTLPTNGRGLNPLLHNYWITIHPPILFTGFAMMSVPFAFAMAALVKRDYHNWIRIALPWTLLATAVLGFGIMLGGFWAYETLGWGGFWGWDPVENSSLIPWLVGVALVHTMLTQKRTKGLVKTNLALAITVFILVLYSTFLTRSGVLGDTSVHSFVDPGFFAYVLLVLFMSVFALIGYGMIFFRAKDIYAQKANFSTTSREFGLAIGSAVVMASAIIVLIGTSWPLVAELLGKPKVAIDPAFYDTMHLPIAIIVVFLNAITLHLRWKLTSVDFFRKLIPSGIASVIATGISFALGIRDIPFVFLALGSFFALFVNLELAFRVLRKAPSFSGAYISHFGIALLMLGIITTARYSVLEHVQLPINVPKQALGFTFTYLGKEQIEKQYADREKHEYLVKVEKEGKSTIVRPILYLHDFNKRQSFFQEPGINWGVLKDVYVAPKAIETQNETPMYLAVKGEPFKMPLDSSYSITLLRFDMSAAQANPDPNAMKMGIILEIERAGVKTEQKIYTKFIGGMDGEKQFEPGVIENTPITIQFEKIIPNKESLGKSQVLLSFNDKSKPLSKPQEVFTIEASIKPLINLVWFGVIFMVFGFFVSIARRAKELRFEDAAMDVIPEVKAENTQD